MNNRSAAAAVVLSPLALRASCSSRVLAVAVAACCAPVALAAKVDLPRYPALSPDGTRMTFTWRGDLWSAPSDGGTAVRLTSSPAVEARSAFSPDGSRIVFESERDGLRNLWSIAPDGSDLKRLTELDAAFALSSVGMLGGKPTIFIDSTIEGDLFRSARPFVLPLEGGVPTRLHDAFGTAASVSPDGAKVIFERGGMSWVRRGYNGPDNHNVWMFDPATKAFTQLTKYDGNDGMPRWISADQYVYLSDRGTGAYNLHRARIGEAPDTGKRLTDFTADDINGLAVSGDGKTAVFCVLGDLFRIDLSKEGAKAEKFALTAADDALSDREIKQVGKSVSDAALSPDGKTMAVVADGDVFVRSVDDKSPTRRVTEGEGRERDICWSADGMTLYFASDRDGHDALYAATVAETRSEAREHGKLKKDAPKAEPKKDEPKKDEAKKDETKKDEPKPEVKPEEPAKDPAPTPAAEPAKDEPKPEAKPEAKKDDAKKDDAKPDAKKEEKKKDPKLDPARWADAIRFDVKPLVQGTDNDRRPVASPDGKCVLFTRNLGDLARLDLATGDVKVIHPGWDDELEYVFSPDGKVIAMAESDADFNKDIWLLAADGSVPAVNVTRHPDNDTRPRFSADGKILAFLSERTNEEFDVWMVMLDRDLEGYSQRDLDQYFKDAAEAAKKRKPLEVKAPEVKAPEMKGAEAKKEEPKKEEAKKDEPAKDEPKKDEPKKDEPKKDPFDGLELDDAYLRVRRVSTALGDEGNLEITPAGDRMVFTAADGKESALFTIKYDGTDQKKIGASMGVAGLSFAGDRVIGVAAGQAQSVGLAAAGDAKVVDITATSEIDLAKRNIEKLEEVSRIMGMKFYKDPKDKGLDWPALTARHRELASRARTADEFDFVANMFIGHLDGSHLGVRSPDANGGAAGARRAQGRLGVTTVAAEGGRAVTAVLPESPASLVNPRIEVGDVITAVDFEPVDAAKPLESMLAGKSGQEVFVSFTRRAKDAAPDAKPLELGVLVVPMSSATERTLRYNAETMANARKVDELSKGRLGYIHIAAMDQASLDRFERDLYAAANGKDGLVVDVRNNGGGSTADRLLASIDVRTHAYTVPREGDPTRKNSYPQDRLYIQRYTMPMAMLCNEKSFSNAEITAHAFKTLGRGPLVGQQTAGGVISTGSDSLVDGTTVRTPFRGWYLADGTDMEEHGAMPDFVVVQTPEDESRNFDAQLAKAVEELMKKLPKK